MKALVTGGAGFIGSHLVDLLLSKGCEVVVIDSLATGRRSQVPEKAVFLQGDVSDAELLAKALPGCDVIFHLAAVCNACAARSCCVSQGAALCFFLLGRRLWRYWGRTRPRGHGSQANESLRGAEVGFRALLSSLPSFARPRDGLPAIFQCVWSATARRLALFRSHRQIH